MTRRRTPTNSLRRTGVALLAAATLAVLPVVGPQEGAGATAAASAESGSRAWHGGWAASPQPPSAPYFPNWSEQGFADHTVRQVVRVTTGGTRTRIELSNRYGTTPLRITGATVARAGEGASVQPGSVRRLTFGKGRSVSVPAGGTVHSDGVPFTVGALDAVTVTLYLAEPTGPATFHSFASATSYRATGDHRYDRSGSAFKETSESWYFLTGVEVSGGTTARNDAVVTFGDSITDGVGSTLDADNRYPDELAERFAAAGRPRSVLNHGIGGNQVTKDTVWAGEKGVTRFELDALDEPNVGTVVVLEGINDFGSSGWNDGSPEVSVEQLIEGHRSLIRQAHDRGVKVIGATLTPVKGSFYYTPVNEAKRKAFNHWMRTSGEYDAVVDFDRALADPADPDRILPAYDSGDHLHPGDAGYRAMAEALRLDEL